MPADETSTNAAPAGLRRTLTLWDLILYGVIVIQPVAPMGVFGVIHNRAGGHVVTTILIAMVAMLFTAISYGRMARAYPSAGSAFTYVGQEINPALGYVTGWSMVMDYILNPLICIILCSDLSVSYAPAVPHWVWQVFYFFLFTGLNLVGVKTSARMNSALAAFMGVVVALFFIAAARFVFGHPHGDAGFFTMPFYNPNTYHMKAVLGGTSIAVLTYIGFDGISTLSEEAENPRRNILLATVFTCVIIGLLSAVEVYAAQLVWHSAAPFKSEDTAFVQIAGVAGGRWMFAVLNLTLLIANIGSGMGAQLGAARLLFGMGRSNALPKSFFGALDPKRHIPRNNVIFVGVIALTGAFLLTYGLGAEMLNFGALIAFMGVNAAAFVRYYLRAERKTLANLLPPLIGFVVCLLLWVNLSRQSWIVGSVWMAVGIAFGAWKTGGFRRNLVDFEIPAEE